MQIKSLISLTLLTSHSAFAVPSFLGDFVSNYENLNIDTTKLVEENACGICHVNPAGGGKRNPYGKDFEKNMGADNPFLAIETLDSDADKVNNLAEIKANTNPGTVP